MVSDLVTSVPLMCKTRKWILTYSNGLLCCVKNGNLIALIFLELYRFDFYAIYKNQQDPFSHITFHIHVVRQHYHYYDRHVCILFCVLLHIVRIYSDGHAYISSNLTYEFICGSKFQHTLSECK